MQGGGSRPVSTVRDSWRAMLPRASRLPMSTAESDYFNWNSGLHVVTPGQRDADSASRIAAGAAHGNGLGFTGNSCSSRIARQFPVTSSAFARQAPFGLKRADDAQKGFDKRTVGSSVLHINAECHDEVGNEFSRLLWSANPTSTDASVSAAFGRQSRPVKSVRIAEDSIYAFDWCFE